MARFATGPVPAWLEDADDEDLSQYAAVLSVEQARATLISRLEERILYLKHGREDEIRRELARTLVEAAAEGRVADLEGLIALARDLPGL